MTKDKTTPTDLSEKDLDQVTGGKDSSEAHLDDRTGKPGAKTKDGFAFEGGLGTTRVIEGQASKGQI